jgi:hypothetical protein
VRDEEEGKERMLEVGVVMGVAVELVDEVVAADIVKDEGAVWRWRNRVRRVRRGSVCWGISEARVDAGPGWG